MRCCRQSKSLKAATAMPTQRMAESGRYIAESSSTSPLFHVICLNIRKVYMHGDIKALSCAVHGEVKAHAAYIESLRLT